MSGNILRTSGGGTVKLRVDSARVVNAVSPTAKVEANDDGALITVHDLNGTTTAQINHGSDGASGSQGPAGADGQDGHTPVIAATKSGKVTTITVDGDVLATINDGEDGEDGQDGYTPTISVSQTASGVTITIRDEDGPRSVSLSNGEPGADGDPGVGVPSGGTAGQILKKTSATDYATEWADLNPVVTVTGSTPTITALPGVQYECSEVSALDITLPNSGIVDVTFMSGSTPTVLTINPPTGMTVEWANDFDSTSLEADTLYELNIRMVGTKCLGVAGQWS